MTITKKILKQRGRRSKLTNLRHLDLSRLGLGKLNNIDECQRLESVDLRWNCLEEIDNFRIFRNLWWLDLSFNQVKCLASFTQLHSLGLLNLSHNLLTWKDLFYLSDLHILDLRLHGNNQLESDAYYRMHVVDCLPNIWMFDGRLVTTTERQQIQHFFNQSALTFKPVRHYRSKNIRRNFINNVSKATVFGGHAEKVSKLFAVNEKHTAETDVRRLDYLAENFDLRLGLNDSESSPINCLRDIICNRKMDKQNCSVLLLLLVSAIEFNLPDELLRQAFQICQMENQFNCEIGDLLKLSRNMQIEVVCILVSACKLERDVLQGSAAEKVLTEDGLYDRLYLALYHSVDRFLRQTKEKEPKIFGKYRAFQRTVLIDSPSSRRVSPSKMYTRRATIHEMNKEWKAHRNLIASEIVLFFSILPQFYQCVTEKHRGVCSLLKIATGDDSISNRLSLISNDLQNKGGDVETLYKEVSEGIRQHIEIAVNNTIYQQEKIPLGSPQHGTVPVNTTKARFILGASQSYQKRPKSAAIISGERLLVSKGSNRANSVGIVSNREFRPLKKLKIGDKILLGAQNIGKVLAVPDTDTALVQLNHVPDKVGCLPLREDNSDLYHCYVDVNLLEYDWNQFLWRPIDPLPDQSLFEVPNNTNTGMEKMDNFLEYHSAPSSQIALASQSGMPLPSDSSMVSSSALDQYTNSLILNLTPKQTKNSETEFEMPLSSHFCNRKNLSLSKSMEKLLKESGEYSDVEEVNKQDVSHSQISPTFVTECPVDPPSENHAENGGSAGRIKSEEGNPDLPKQNVGQKKIRFPNFENTEDGEVEDEEQRNNEEAMLMKVVHKTEEGVNEADMRRAKSATPTRAIRDTKFGGRPISARVTKKQVSFFKEGFYEDETGVASSFQLRRTEAWRSSASSFSDSQNTKKVVIFQQPQVTAQDNSSPTTNNVTTTSIVLRENTIPSATTTTISIPTTTSTTTRQPQHNVAVVHEKHKPSSTDIKKPPTGKWLAEGRDLHQEKEVWKRHQLITNSHDIQGTSCLPKPNKRSSTINLKRKQAAKSTTGIGSFAYSKPNVFADQPVLKGTFPMLLHKPPTTPGINPPSNLSSTLMRLHIKPNPLGTKQSAKLLRF